MFLGIEFGSTRIKACAIDSRGVTLATGMHKWRNHLTDGHWSYSMAEVTDGLRAAYADLCDNLGSHPTAFDAMGISAMMHGYLACDADGALLVPFRTWRDTTTGKAAEVLTKAFGVTVPLRWSVAHHYQAVLDGEEHVPRVAALHTLSSYVHLLLTGRHVVGLGDAVGMFPLDTCTGQYHPGMVETYQKLSGVDITQLLPAPLPAGAPAGTLTPEGARLLDPTGALRPGVPMCPPEGDAGTGMVATNAVRPRTGNVSVGTSIFAMVVLERALTSAHPEVDPVATPDGHPVAMVHCNNGTSELNTWMELFSNVAVAFGKQCILDMDDVYRVLLTEALHADRDAGGLTVFNYLSGEPITRLEQGRPLVARGPESRLTVGNFLRAQLFASFATLELGMRVLRSEGVALDVLKAHGGLFRTAGVGQRLLAAALNTPVGVADSASEGGAWGCAVLARYLGDHRPLAEFLEQEIFTQQEDHVITPDPRDREGFEAFLHRFERALPLQRSAAELIATKELDS